jgi:hypothetical protein
MDTLLAIGMLVGLWKGHAEPPKVVTPPAELRQVTAEKPKPRKTSEWPLGY